MSCALAAAALTSTVLALLNSQSGAFDGPDCHPQRLRLSNINKFPSVLSWPVHGASSSLLRAFPGDL